MAHDEQVGDLELLRFRELVRKRVEGCPVAYLVGRKEFFSLPLEVNRAVLIPRPESEFVVMECLRLAKEMQEPTVLDIGVGSGNLSVAIAHQHKTARITAVDISPEALAVATGNAGKHGVAERDIGQRETAMPEKDGFVIALTTGFQPCDHLSEFSVVARFIELPRFEMGAQCPEAAGTSLAEIIHEEFVGNIGKR